MKKMYAEVRTSWNISARKMENDMNWTHIMNDAKGNTDLCKLYQVQGFPTKVLIDPQGKIVEVYVGEVPEFYQKLDELLK